MLCSISLASLMEYPSDMNTLAALPATTHLVLISFRTPRDATVLLVPVSVPQRNFSAPSKVSRLLERRNKWGA